MTALDLDAIEAAAEGGSYDYATTLALVARVREFEALATDAAQAICGMADHAEVREARVRELEAIIAGCAEGPTDAEIVALEAAGGRWLYMTGGENGLSYSRGNTRAWREHIAEMGHSCRWWPLDASGRPCAWPVTT